MHGFKDPKMFDWMVGREIVQLGVGQYQVNLSFHPSGTMSVEGGWQLLDPAGKLVDRSMEHSERTEHRLHHLIGSPVSSVAVESTRSATMSFANGFQLRLVDDDPRYEAVVMCPGDGRVIVV